MKIENVKHNHSLTDLLKIILFAILMLAPIGSVATRCLYVVCNKNAYQSYYGETINKVSYENIETFEQNKNYHFKSSLQSLTSSFNNNYFTCDEIKNFVATPNDSRDFTSCNNGFVYWNSGAAAPTIALFHDQTNLAYINMNNNIIEFDFVNLATQTENTQLKGYLTNIVYNNYAYLDNVFEYSIKQLEQSNLFNWTENTLIYTGINNMCTQLNITIAAIPMILTYWLMLTCIYVIIDIVLKLFTLLTHMIGNRKA